MTLLAVDSPRLCAVAILIRDVAPDGERVCRSTTQCRGRMGTPVPPVPS